jgi:hypothetical protein
MHVIGTNLMAQNMEVSGQLHAPTILPLGRQTPMLLDRRLGGPQSRSVRGGERDRVPLSGIEPRSSNHYLNHCTD